MFPITEHDVDGPGVRIDVAHANLIFGLVCAQKPERILEFGFGGGRSALAILSAIEFNRKKADYTIVDSWADWGGDIPESADSFFAQHSGKVRSITSDECAFVNACKQQYSFIMSDADHEKTDQWFEKVYDDMLAPGGIVCYHDCRNFPNIGEIETKCKQRAIPFVVFCESSTPTEACHRGLLVIFKPMD